MAVFLQQLGDWPACENSAIHNYAEHSKVPSHFPRIPARHRHVPEITWKHNAVPILIIFSPWQIRGHHNSWISHCFTTEHLKIAEEGLQPGQSQALREIRRTLAKGTTKEKKTCHKLSIREPCFILTIIVYPLNCRHISPSLLSVEGLEGKGWPKFLWSCIPGYANNASPVSPKPYWDFLVTQDHRLGPSRMVPSVLDGLLWRQ